jgi:protein ImuB
MFVCLVRDSLSASVPGVLESVARACSPRVEPHGDDAVVCDARGLTRVMGEPAVIAEEMRRMAWEREVGVRVAITGTHTAAWLLAHARPGITVIPPGEEARALSRLPISVLSRLPECAECAGSKDPASISTASIRRATSSARRNKAAKGPAFVQLLRDALATLDRWGVATLGDLARLPRADVASRLGVAGQRLHEAAWGEDVTPLVASDEAPRFVERVELEWPVEGLEPLSFVLARVCDALAGVLERADRGAVTLTTRLTLVNRTLHERVLTLPAPMRDAKVLRTLILLDLETQPPSAGIDVVEVECGVTPGRILQKSLLAHDVPAVEDVATLVARLQALMGDARVGAPVLVDTHNPRVSAMRPFVAPAHVLRRPAGSKDPASDMQTSSTQHCSIRRFRLPVAAEVQMDRGMPARLHISSRGMSSQGMTGGDITFRAGPWRTSGQWWTADRDTWDRDEWDVAVESGVIYRLTRDRVSERWEIEGVID